MKITIKRSECCLKSYKAACDWQAPRLGWSLFTFFEKLGNMQKMEIDSRKKLCMLVCKYISYKAICGESIELESLFSGLYCCVQNIERTGCLSKNFPLELERKKERKKIQIKNLAALFSYKWRLLWLISDDSLLLNFYSVSSNRLILSWGLFLFALRTAKAKECRVKS